eukprot:TRINITY_DN9020_c0_g1_i8.p1 TRINITY_DN9020_c0_g1~~TRINITY_DN9020_c0_g1_i8.p1  ORF type:complete len:112 (+),score=26.89 TRINITY_DN9020_c0_g1_i8:404-739(+)
MAIKKAPATREAKDQNSELATIRVPIEQYFSRMWKSWAICRQTYPFHFTKLDEDFPLLALLTNEVIQASEDDTLDETDAKYLAAHIQERKRYTQERACSSTRDIKERERIT